MQGNPVAGKMKNFLRGLAVVTVPLTASFPSVRPLIELHFNHSWLRPHLHFISETCVQALFCYWLTSNVFSMVQANSKSSVMMFELG